MSDLHVDFYGMTSMPRPADGDRGSSAIRAGTPGENHSFDPALVMEIGDD